MVEIVLFDLGSWLLAGHVSVFKTKEEGKFEVGTGSEALIKSLRALPPSPNLFVTFVNPTVFRTTKIPPKSWFLFPSNTTTVALLFLPVTAFVWTPQRSKLDCCFFPSWSLLKVGNVYVVLQAWEINRFTSLNNKNSTVLSLSVKVQLLESYSLLFSSHHTWFCAKEVKTWLLQSLL